MSNRLYALWLRLENIHIECHGINGITYRHSPNDSYPLQTGCRITLTDISSEGLKAASRKADIHGLNDRYHCVRTGAARLPFFSDSFDAIGHADVLCCLEEKLQSLRECRRVIRGHGVMAFSVLHMRPGADARETEHAAAAGPSPIAAPADYPTMLEQTDWAIALHSDITEGYFNILETLLEAYEGNRNEVCSQRSEEHYEELVDKCISKSNIVAGGSVRRSLFTVTPV